MKRAGQGQRAKRALTGSQMQPKKGLTGRRKGKFPLGEPELCLFAFRASKGLLNASLSLSLSLSLSWGQRRRRKKAYA